MRLTTQAGVQAESIELDTQAARFIGSMTAVAEDHSVSLLSELMWGRVLLLVCSQRRTTLPMRYTPSASPTAFQFVENAGGRCVEIRRPGEDDVSVRRVKRGARDGRPVSYPPRQRSVEFQLGRQRTVV
jgi:hypothetical protein